MTGTTDVTSGVVVGIDLGTSNSCIALQKLNPQILLNGDGDMLTPSAVTALTPQLDFLKKILSKDDKTVEFVVGKSAKDLLKQYPHDTVLSIKRLMGREFEEPEVQALIKQKKFAYVLKTDENNPGSIQVCVAQQKFTPSFLSSLILKKIIKEGEAFVKDTIAKAVVTVPAYFSDRQKFATRAACELAGIQLLRLLPEPTAAALSFGVHEMTPEDSKTVMVFDLGGGTFDISILSVAGGHFMEVTKGGDMWLGGDDVDDRIRSYVLQTAEKALDGVSIQDCIDALDPLSQARFKGELLHLCEQAKMQLSTESEATVESFGLLKDLKGNLIDIDVTITRQVLDGLLQPFVEKMLSITDALLRDVHFEKDLIDMVLMVGGSSLIPAVQNALKESFGAEKVQVHPRPLFAVVEGAAIMAKSLASEQQTSHAQTAIHLMHSTAHDYYLQLAQGQRHLLVAKNSPLPAQVEENLVFVNKNQHIARLRVLNDVDGILESVGEMWFFKDKIPTFAELFKLDTHLAHSIDFQKDEAAQCGAAITLKFTVNEDNMIHMQASLKDNPLQKMENMIVRGGVAVSLFSQLESAFAHIVPNIDCGIFMTECLVFVQHIVHTILQVSDPVTGVVSYDKKLLVLNQIETLKVLGQEFQATLASCIGLKQFLHFAPAVLPKEQRVQLQTIYENWKAEFLEFSDADEIMELKSSSYEIICDDPTAEIVSEALAIAESIRKNYPKDAAQILESVEGVNSCSQKGLEQHKFVYLSQIQAILHKYTPVESDNLPSRFERDVCLA